MTIHAQPRLGAPRQRRWTAAVTVLATLFVTLLGTMLTAPAASAAEYPAGEWGTYNGASTHWGNILVDGTYGYCVDPGVTPPSSLDRSKANRVCGKTDADGTPDKAAQMAYLLARYQKTTDTAVAASVSQFARAQYNPDIPITHQGTYDRIVAEAVRNSGPRDVLVQVDADKLTVGYGLVRAGESTGDTAHFADGFTATLTITTPNATFAGGAQSVTVTTGTAMGSVGLVPRHPLIADEPVTVSMAVKDVPESCYLLYAQGATQRIAVPLATTVAGEATGKPAETKWQPKVSSQLDQTALTAGATTVVDKVRAEAVGGTQWPVSQWADAIQTQPKTYFPLVASGEIVRAPVPPAASAVLPDGAVVLPGGPTLVTLPGPGVWAAADVPLPANPGSGHYSLRWCLDAAYQGEYAKYLPKGGPFCDDYFSATERFTVPMRIAVASTLPDQYQPKGTAPDDTITLSLPDAADQWISGADGKPVAVKVEGVYYAGSASSFTLADTPPADAAVLGAASVNVTLPTSGREPVTVKAPAGFTVPTSQYGVWVWRIDKDHQTGQAKPLVAASVADKFGQRLETHVTQMELAIGSHVKDETIPEPAGDATVQVCDTVWVDHGSPTDLWLNQWGTDKPLEVIVNGRLHHSAVPAAQTTRLDNGVPAVEEWELTFTAAGKNHAQTVCHPVGYGDYGAYGFQWRIDLANQPDATTDYLAKGATTPLWLPVETTMVRRTPVIHTAATKWETTKDGDVTVFFQDDLWADDWPDGPADTDAHGAVQHGQWAGLAPWSPDIKTVTVDLWRIEGPVTPDSCTADNPDATLVATNTLTGAQNTWAAAQKVSGSKFKAEGGEATYTFVVSSPGDSRTEPFRTVCGEKTETITIIPAPPSFVTQLVTSADKTASTIEAATRQETALTVEPGAGMVDVLHVWYPDDATGPRTDMAGWQATWDVYYVPAGDDPVTSTIIETDGGRKVYEGATCTPDTLLTSLSEPVRVERPGTFTSPVFTAPDEPGMIYVVETVTNTPGKDGPAVVQRGLCGLVSESAVIPQPEPAPQITTKAPATATVGDHITDEATLTGPYAKGDQVDFWYQTGEFTNPDAPAEELVCIKPHPNDMTGATHIGTVTLDHDIPAGTIETITSPEFTTEKPGCTFIKEIATRPGDEDEQPTVIAQGWFGAADETTIWTPPPPMRTIETGGSALPNTGTNALPWILAGGACLLMGGVLIGVICWRRRSM